MNARMIFILVENKPKELLIVISFKCVSNVTRFLSTCFFDNVNIMIIENLSQLIVVFYNLVVMDQGNIITDQASFIRKKRFNQFPKVLIRH